jgi:hypothetical protein
MTTEMSGDDPGERDVPGLEGADKILLLSLQVR